MHGSPESKRFAAFVDRATRRARWIGATFAVASALGAASLVVLLLGGRESPLPSIIVSLFLVGGAIAWARRRTSADRVVAIVERRTPASRNLVLTAAELLERKQPIAHYLATRIYEDAIRLAETIDLRTVLPSRTAVAALVAAGLAWSGAMAATGTGTRALLGHITGAEPSHLGVGSVEIELVPPAYTGQQTVTVRDPSRIEAIAGSQIRLTVTANAAVVDLETIDATQQLGRTGNGEFSGTLVAVADGYIAVAPKGPDGTEGTRRLIGLTVTPDRPPRVTMTAPGKDMVLPNGRRTLPFAIEADDDWGLASLTMRYIKVSGSGENFTFKNGEVETATARADDRTWTASGNWALTALNLEPGDMVIYRGVATDRRPGAPAVESDSFIIEIVAAGALPSEGFAIDDRQDKYAISQQMVIVNTERLLAKRATMTAEDFRREADGIAAEQRQVRAEFVFMMGGELADMGVDMTTLNEEAEAAGEGDLAAGRMANQGRIDLLRAIRAMSRAAAQLVEPDIAPALPLEKEALTYLQRAFSRSRYILRTLGERERLDASRRLTGVLGALDRSSRPVAESAPSPRVAVLRRVLGDIAALAASNGRAADPRGAGQAAALAQRVLQVDPASAPLHEVASALTRASTLLSARAQPSAVQAEFDRAASALAAIARGALPRDPSMSSQPGLDALAGSLANALRRGGRP